MMETTNNTHPREATPMPETGSGVNTEPREEESKATLAQGEVGASREAGEHAEGSESGRGAGGGTAGTTMTMGEKAEPPG